MLKPVALLLLLAGVVHTVPPPVCIVTGSTVIDFFNRIQSVPDRCIYRLLRPVESTFLDILAGFRERSRTDVPFLDSLTITAAISTIYLGQGGIVRVDDQTPTLNATAQLINGVEFSKDQDGVTVQMGAFTITFDGNTAVITGFAFAAEGLCGNPTNTTQTFNLAAQKSSSSVAGYVLVLTCEVLYSEPPNNMTNCQLITERCNLLMQAPFTDCHDQVNPAPYITACAETSCKFPTEEGLALSCQFLDAYAKTCSLNTTITLGDWRSPDDCPVPQVPCMELYCSNNEYCGENNGETQCFCRALFATKYTPTNSLGDPTVCIENSATLTLAGCLLSAKNIDYTTLHLIDESCKGHMDNEAHMVTFSFDSNNTCGTEVMSNNKSQIIYQNTIMMQNSSTDVITRHDQVMIDFSCLYTKPDIRSVSFKIKDSSVVLQIVSGIWNYTLMMKAYTDGSFINVVGPDTELVLDQKVWVELMTVGLDDNMVSIVTDSCWATNQPSPNASVQYNLVINGCPNPADHTVKVQGNGLGTSNSFSFNMFQFSGKAPDIYLHCKLELCPKHSNSCAPSCSGSGRRRRSLRAKRADENPALITMAWNN
ncbi:alpha-tectorin-like isoform X1 [Sander lucioperca]|uniref:alpha-tectorin-like isoform X1 n=1 Tax=Sander lucioperca TaxID=283035 RepID=UPI001653889A|nr:alpha-tectorin-like isoform X1 [Sander lucioperca]